MALQTRTKMLAWSAIIIAVILVAWSGFLGSWSKDYWESALLQVGSTLALVPGVVYVERLFEKRADSVKRELLGSLAKVSSIGEDPTLREAFPVMDRYFATRHESQLVIKMGDRKLWLSFGLYATYIGCQSVANIFVYYGDPELDNEQDRGPVAQWNETETLSIALAKVDRLIADDAEHRSLADFAAGPIVREFRDRLRQGVG